MTDPLYVSLPTVLLILLVVGYYVKRSRDHAEGPLAAPAADTGDADAASDAGPETLPPREKCGFCGAYKPLAATVCPYCARIL